MSERPEVTTEEIPFIGRDVEVVNGRLVYRVTYTNERTKVSVEGTESELTASRIMHRTQGVPGDSYSYTRPAGNISGRVKIVKPVKQLRFVYLYE